MANLNLIQNMHKKTKRNYVQRVIEYDKAKCSKIAKLFGKDYWDGERQYGYGGYTYDGRWLWLAEKLAEHFNLTKNDSVLDIGCGKGFLLYELTKILPGINVRGLDISKYAIENAKPEIKEFLVEGAAENLPFRDSEFDAVFSLGTLHNLSLKSLYKSIGEINRVCKNENSYIMVESWRSEEEKANLLYWQLTCESFFSVGDWEWIYKKSGFRGDWDFIFFE